jgi:hypothetical protein
VYALLGPLGVGFLVAAYMFRDGGGGKVAAFGIAGVACLGAMIVLTPATKGSRGDCFVDWDARSNSIVCD